MLQYERIILSDKRGKSKECEIYNYTYFNDGFRLDSKVCNEFNREITAFELKNLAIVNVRGIGHRVFMFHMTEDNVHNILGDFKSSKL